MLHISVAVREANLMDRFRSAERACLKIVTLASACPFSHVLPQLHDWDTSCLGLSHHVSSSFAARECYHQLRLTNLEHLLIPYWTRKPSILLPVRSKDGGWDVVLSGPYFGQEVSAAGTSIDHLSDWKQAQRPSKAIQVLVVSAAAD